MSTEKGPYRAYQSAVDPNLWLVRHGTVGQVYEYPTPITAGNACDALNTAYAAGQEDRSLAPPPAKELSDEEITRIGNDLLGPVNDTPGVESARFWITKALRHANGYLKP